MAAASLAVSPAMARATAAAHITQAAPDRSAALLGRSSFSGRPLKAAAALPRRPRSAARHHHPRTPQGVVAACECADDRLHAGLVASSYELMIPNLAKTGRLEAAYKLFDQMKQRALRPSVGIFAALVDSMGKAGRLDGAMKAYMEMQGFGYRPTAAMFVSLIIRQLFESCMKGGLYESAKPLLDTYVNSAAKVDLILYTSILAHLVRCQDEQKERHIMEILGATKHKAHSFMCGLFTGTEQRKTPVLSFVREFFQLMCCSMLSSTLLGMTASR